MQPSLFLTGGRTSVARVAAALLEANQANIYRRTDRLFACLMLLQWIAGIACAYTISPRTWSGAASEPHMHIWASVVLGGIISLLPVGLVLLIPGRVLTRHVVAIAQMLSSALLIHLSGGRIETHFHVFGSLAILACYRDWRVLVTATMVVTADHFVRGVFYPQSVFGVLTANPWRVIEHAGWVVFENVFLTIAIAQSVREMADMAQHRAELEAANDNFEAEVECRMRELQTANHMIRETNGKLERQAAVLESQAQQLQEAKQRAEELGAFGQILDRSLNEIYIFERASLRFVHVNHGARENIGYTMDELSQLTPLDIKPQHTHASFAELIRPLLEQSQDSISFRTVHRRKNGSVYPVEVHLEASVLGDKPVFAAVILDITQRQLLEEQLKSSRERALAADRSKSEFLANMSHEIRTPMTAILGFNDIILESATDLDNIDAARTVKANGEYLINLINDILDLSKVEAGKLDIEQSLCSPHEIVADIASLMRVRAESKNLSLEVRFDGPVPETIRTDPTRLRQLLINVIGNAIKFTEFGSIQIVTRLVDATEEQPKLQFDVIDTGIGIAPDKLEKIFSPFTQADSSTTREFGGTGLGLTISKRVAELLGGKIGVSSQVDRGSTFSITVETGSLENVVLFDNGHESIRATSSRADAAERTQSTALDCRILLAEDGPDNQRLISFILRKAGAEVEIADNGQRAYELAIEAVDAGRPFEIILMDMQMPILDGYCATKKLRQAGYSGAIVALTAHAMSGDRQKCLDAGCDDYISKPIQRESMLATIAARSASPLAHSL